MRFVGGLVREEIASLFLFHVQAEMRRVMKRSAYMAMYGNFAAVEEERDFTVMYLMGGEI